MTGPTQQHETLGGVYPRVGDLVWMTKAVSYRYEHSPAWFRVLGICQSTQDGWVYLHGYEVDENVRVERAVFSASPGW